MKIIKCLRELEGITQKELANNLSISRSYLSEIESGKVTPSVTILISLCNHFKSHPCVFLCGRLNKDIPVCSTCQIKNIIKEPRRSMAYVNKIRKNIEEGSYRIELPKDIENSH